MEFAEVRAYELGDDFRSIDWNVSARLASPYVKTFTEERELTLMLVVDQSGSTRFGEPVSKAGLAVEVASVLALAAAYHNDRVGALLFADEVDRKSTRLNSSHSQISYAVFCLKKKKN